MFLFAFFFYFSGIYWEEQSISRMLILISKVRVSRGSFWRLEESNSSGGVVGSNVSHELKIWREGTF